MFFQRLRNVFSKTSKPFRGGPGNQCGFTYDENGNMTCRLESGVTYTQTYNAENRIASIQKLASGGTCAAPGPLTDKWDFTGACPEQRRRDGDGTRTGQLYTPYTDGDPGDAVTTRYFFGGAYETTGSAWKKYYSFGGTTLMRDADGFKYFLSDHLGSVSVVLDDAGEIIEQQRYLPFGQARVMPPYASVTSTDFTYTGQRNIAGTGFMDYKARFYSPYITHFSQPDTIVPNLYNPQSLNRYSYVLNNPINASDPSGHKPCTSNYRCQIKMKKLGDAEAAAEEAAAQAAISSSSFDDDYGILFEGDWQMQGQDKKYIVRLAVYSAARALLRDYLSTCASTCQNYSEAQLFNKVYNGVTFAKVASYTDLEGKPHYSGAITKNAHRIEVASLPQSYWPDDSSNKTPAMAEKEGINNIVHELGHAFAQKWYQGGTYDDDGPYVNIPANLLSNDGFYQYPGPVGASATWRQHPCTGGYDCPGEVFADMFLGWTFAAWALGTAGNDRRDFMNQDMGSWIAHWAPP